MTSQISYIDKDSLRKLLHHQDKPVESLLPEELNTLITSFHPSYSSSIHAQLLFFLSKFSSDIRQKYASKSDSAAATSFLVRTFAAPIEASLADTHEPSTVAALSFLSALFQVDWASASAILSRDGVLDSVLETQDIYPASKDAVLTVARLLSQASGHQECRRLLAVPPIFSWLEKSTMQAADQALCAAAAVALVKLSRGSDIDSKNDSLGGVSTALPGKSTGSTVADDTLVSLMKNILLTDEPSSSSILDAVEGLAYLTIKPTIKETVSGDSLLLNRLIGFVPRRPPTAPFPASHVEHSTKSKKGPEIDLGMSYGVAAIISNLCEYKLHLSEEERQIERLRRMTKTPTQSGKLSSTVADVSVDSDTLEDNDHVRVRGERLMQAGVVDALTSIIKGLGSTSEAKRSIAVQRTVAKAFLSLVEEKANRGKILQGGGAKALLTIISASLTEIRDVTEDGQRDIDRLDLSDLPAIQALAKLSITSSPAAVFGPTKDSYISAIRPFALLLCHSSASLLQRFEAIMALTNIASVSCNAAERISTFHFTPGKGQSVPEVIGDITKRAEASLLDGNTMVRRAATELVCNLAGGSESSFDYFGGSASINAKSRLQILVALADVEDLPTRLAASGALAVLTASPAACNCLVNLEMERHHVVPVLVELISPEIASECQEEHPDEKTEGVAVPDKGVSNDLGLVHRGVVCVRNIFANIDAKNKRKFMAQDTETRGLARALVQVLNSNQEGLAHSAVLKPVAEVLKWIVEAGVKLPL